MDERRTVQEVFEDAYAMALADILAEAVADYGVELAQWLKDEHARARIG